jgi:hypothetical protein
MPAIDIAHIVSLLEDHSPLGVPKDSPSNAAILKLLDRDFSCESAVILVEYILCGDLEALAEEFAGEEEVEGWW